MTKSELIERIASRCQLSKGRAEEVVNTIFDCMTDALRRGEGIEIRGFGSFTVRQYKAYDGRNPRTGEGVRVSPKRLPFFKVGKDLRERINADPVSSPALASRAATSPSAAPAEAKASRTNRRRSERSNVPPSEDVI
ncbi:MAG: integration host factor subunit beta [Myxococcales bacterium FL481]|nr:MAG: integration host factor subunit beta [Myxococcales bacterium FL481]